jgi:hypothetical protein
LKEHVIFRVVLCYLYRSPNVDFTFMQSSSVWVEAVMLILDLLVASKCKNEYKKPKK